MKKLITYTFILLTFSCVLFKCNYTVEKRQIIVKGDYITLAWNPPPYGSINEIQQLELYRLYYRNRGETLWTLIAEIPADGALEYTLYHEDFGDGKYEFAVCVINTKGLSSPLHASTDQNAEPSGGWYLFWIGNS